MDFNGGMFIEMGMNQRWSCFLHRLYPHTMFSSSCIYNMEDMHSMHKIIMPALLVQLNRNVSTHPGYYSTKTTASVVCGCECQTIS